jgi:hypothetical protein
MIESLDIPLPPRMSLLVLREGEFLVIQCLEYDVAAQGRSIDEVVIDVERAFLGQLVAYMEIGEDPYSKLGKAPEFYWEKWKKAEILAVEADTLQDIEVRWFGDV